jgi:iron complex outermembrane recepter protein
MKKSTMLVVASLGLSCSIQAADDVMEEIVVTATKRATSILDVPFSVNAQTQDDIQESGASNLEELSRNIAGLTIQNLGPGQSQVAIRGVSAGQIIRDQPGVKEQVGVYLDESVISLSLFTPDLDLYDLNRVETLRGPQGTLFGSGSVGGTIRYITNKPKLEVSEFAAEASAGSVTDGELGGHAKGMFNVPVGDNVAVRGVGFYTQYAGYIDAIEENGGESKDVNDGQRLGGRLAATWEVSENLTITPRVVYQEIDMNGYNRQEVFNLFANPYTTTRPAMQLGDREQFLLLGEGFLDETTIWDVTADLALDNMDVVYVGSYTDRNIKVSRDASALTGSVSVDLGFPEASVTLPSNLIDRTKLEQTTHELRISSNSDERLQWLAGVFFSDTERNYSQRLPTPGYDVVTDLTLGAGTSDAVSNGFPADSPFNSDLPYDIEQMALFGELTYDINDQLHLTVGGRFYDFEESRTITTGGVFANGDVGVVDKTSSDGFTPRVLLAYDVSETLTVNAQASQGFRLGGVNDPLNSGLCDPGDLVTFGSFQAYDDETLWNYEAGVKGNSGGVEFGVSAFFADIEDLQVTLDAGSCSSRISFNVPEAHSVGIEFEASAPVTDNLDLSVTGSLLSSEFDSTVTDSTGAILGGVKDGNKLASVPEFQMAFAATYNWPEMVFGGELKMAFSMQHVGTRITQPSDQLINAGDFSSGLPFGGASGSDVTSLDLELDPYTISNFNIAFAKDTWEAVLFVNNLTDENADLSFDKERGGRARLGFRTNNPRTLGVTVRTNF